MLHQERREVAEPTPGSTASSSAGAVQPTKRAAPALPERAARALRLRLMHLIAALLAGTGLATVHAAGDAAALAVEEIRPGVFVHLGKLEDWGPSNGGDVANLGFVVGSRCVAVVDTGGTPKVGRALRAAIERTTPLPVCYVINTHAHPDHMLGNAAFAGTPGPAPKFVASAGFPRTLSAREPYYRNALQRDFGIVLGPNDMVYPDIKVERSLELDLGDRVLALQAWPTAHTDNDLTVYDRRTRTQFASDLLFVSHLPALDGSLRGWIDVMDELKRLDVDTVVPGHGGVGHDWPAAMQPQADYLEALLRDTRSAIARGWTIREAIDRIGAPPAAHWRLTERFQRRNVTAAFAELEWEDDVAKPASAPADSARPRLANPPKRSTAD